MESWHYTVIIVILYALLILWVGTGRWTKVGRVAMDDYFKVAPGFGFLVLYLGIAGGFHTAFAIPGSMGFYHAHGVAFAANVLWTVFTPLGVIYFIGSRITCLGRKFNYITPADLLVDYFGDGKFRAFIAIYILSCCIPLMTANVTGPAVLLSEGTQGNIPYVGALLIMGVMVMIYVTSSGIRGVTWTTVAQAVWMFVAVWAAAIWCLNLIDGNLMTLFNRILETEPSMLTLPGPNGLATPEWWITFPVFGLALYWAILPRGFMFFYSARDVATTRRIGLTVGFYLMTLYLPAMVIGFTAFYFLPEADSDGSFPLMLATYAPAWFAGLIVAGGLAAGMSSLDADTNANSAMLTKDVYATFVRKNAPDRHYITIGRLIVVGLVAVTVAAAAYRWGLVVLMIGVTASMITQLLPAVLAVTVPMGIRFTKAGVTAGILAGLAVSLLSRFFAADLLPDGWRFDPSFWGLVVNIPVTLIVSQFTTPPDPERVARIRAALDEEFRRKPAT
ncbi:MAG: sodium:solute symporter family protein [Rhodospirillaceae bacterium]|nr:sodium:solute symporter family protein [Rhodospirillaceae bacterium]MDE0360357.1 sodium:solute symporter family protein [Rhodospirillaceae bacterium]